MSKIRAYTFLELTMVMIIATMIVVIIVSIAKIFFIDKKDYKTIVRLAEIEESITKYFQKNKKLPCPNNIISKDCICPNVTLIGNIYQGTIPTEELYLLGNYIYDDYDNKFSYLVDKNFICTNNIYGNQANIKIYDINKNIITNNAVYSLISYGEDDIINDEHYIISSYEKHTHFYDDYVIFKTKEQLLIASNINGYILPQDFLKYNESAKIWWDSKNTKSVPQNHSGDLTEINNLISSNTYNNIVVGKPQFNYKDYPFITINNDNHLIHKKNGSSKIFKTASDYSLFFVFHINDKRNSSLVGLYDKARGNNGFVCEQLNINAENQLSYQVGLTNCIDLQNILNNEINIISIIRNNNEVQIFLNGFKQEQAICPIIECGYDSLLVGITSYYLDLEYPNFNFYELLFFEKTLDIEDINDINLYLKTKWQEEKSIHKYKINARFFGAECSLLNDNLLLPEIKNLGKKYCAK